MIICTLLVVAGLCVWLVMRNRGPYEPVYRGKRLGYWLKVQASPATTEERYTARTAFQVMGSNAVPFLVARLVRDGYWDSRKADFNSLVDKWHLPAGIKFTNSASFNAIEGALIITGKSVKPGLIRVFEETSNTNALNVAAQTLYVSQGFASGSRLFNPNAISWEQYLIEQKDVMSPKAWQRLKNAHVVQYRN